MDYEGEARSARGDKEVTMTDGRDEEGMRLG